MNNAVIKYTLKAIRKVFLDNFAKNNKRPSCIHDPDIASNLVSNILKKDAPCMIARFGSTELTCLTNYIGIKNYRNHFFDYIQGKTPPWWWETKILNQMQQWSGFFPPTVEKIEQFCELMLEDMTEVDILGSWLHNERFFEDKIRSAQKVQLIPLDPYWAKTPWTRALEGKKVLVVHPFSDTIKKQYKKRELLFDNDLLPEFELHTIPAVQTIAGTKSHFKDWFEALDFMKGKIDNTDYDICLIGAGAYGFPLAAHVKRSGKKAFHIGGSLQLLFGIRGKRWEKDYHHTYSYAGLINEHWVRPGSNEKPANANVVENGCYW